MKKDNSLEDLLILYLVSVIGIFTSLSVLAYCGVLITVTIPFRSMFNLERNKNMAKIYVASSWRNQHQPQVVSFLREQGHEVYDFRHPAGKTGFQWSQIDEDWRNWSTDQYRAALEHPIAQAGFKSDFDAMQWADVCVLVLPCGRSAHSEAGWMKGAGKKVIVYQIWEEEPELMYKLFDGVCSMGVGLQMFLAEFDKEKNNV